MTSPSHVYYPGRPQEPYIRQICNDISPLYPANAQIGKIVLITGGESGIGAATTQVWVKAGAEGIAIGGRRQHMLDESATEVRELAGRQGEATEVLAVSTDSRDFEQVERLFKETKAKLGQVPDVVITCAGWPGPFARIGRGWRRCVDERLRYRFEGLA